MAVRQHSDAGRVTARLSRFGRFLAGRLGRDSSSPAGEATVGSAVRVAAEIVVRLSAIVATLVITRSLGVAEFGSFVMALAFGLMVAEVADLGINALAVPLIVRDPGHLSALLRLKGIMTGLVLLAASVLIPLGAQGLGLGAAVLALTTAHFLGVTWIDMAGSALRAIGRRRDEAILLCAFRLVLLVLVVSMPASGAESAALAYAIASLVGLGFAVVLVGRTGAVSVVGTAPLGLREMLRLALPLGANGYLALLSTRVEILALQSFGSASLVGLWSGALRVVESLLTFPAAIAAGALPVMSRDVATRAKGAAQRTVGAIVWIGTPAAVGLGFRAPEILSLLGPGFEAGAPALRILAIALLLCFANTALFHLLIAAGQTAVIPRLTAARVAVAGILSAPLIGVFGLSGAAASFTLAEAFLCAMLVHHCRGAVEVDLLRPVRWAMLACGPMVALLLLVQWPLPWSVGASVLLFGLMAATILRRGSEAGGLA